MEAFFDDLDDDLDDLDFTPPPAYKPPTAAQAPEEEKK